MLLLYVDDLLIKDARRRLAAEFEMKDLGMMHQFLGMEVWQSANGISLRQGKYAVDILKRFEMMDWKDMGTPIVDIIVTLECIHLYFLCIVTRCLF